jgi:hypothetical protein
MGIISDRDNFGFWILDFGLIENLEARLKINDIKPQPMMEGTEKMVDWC